MGMPSTTGKVFFKMWETFLNPSESVKCYFTNSWFMACIELSVYIYKYFYFPNQELIGYWWNPWWNEMRVPSCPPYTHKYNVIMSLNLQNDKFHVESHLILECIIFSTIKGRFNWISLFLSTFTYLLVSLHVLNLF